MELKTKDAWWGLSELNKAEDRHQVIKNLEVSGPDQVNRNLDLDPDQTID